MSENRPDRAAEGKGGERQTVTVEIAGERHVLRSDASIEYTKSVAAHLDETIRTVGANLDPHRAAILAALTITDDLFRTRAELKALREEIVRRSSRVAYLLERASDAAREDQREGGSPAPPRRPTG